jgi:hypothetical protein
MKILTLQTETTHYMTVSSDEDPDITYVRTPFGEWCNEVSYGIMTELERVPYIKADQLERLFQSHNTTS